MQMLPSNATREEIFELPVVQIPALIRVWQVKWGLTLYSLLYAHGLFLMDAKRGLGLSM